MRIRCTLLMAALATSVHAAPFVYRDGSAELEEQLASALPSDEPGAAVVVLHGGDIVHRSSHGLAELAARRPVDEHTRFYLASIAKSFTAAAILLLRERGQLDLSQPVAEILPDWPDYAIAVRVYHLLTHSSGLPEIELDPSTETIRNATVLSALRAAGELSFDPGVESAYSNAGYVVLAVIVEQLSGQSYAEYLRQNLFEPLGMFETVVYDERRPAIPARAKGYRGEDGGFVDDDYENRLTTGPGGIYGSLHDLEIWLRAALDRRLLSAASWDLMFDMPTTLRGKRSWLAMGWFDETFGPKTPPFEGLRAYGAIGVLAGFRTMIKIFPEYDLSFIVLCNRGQFPLGGKEVAEAFLLPAGP